MKNCKISQILAYSMLAYCIASVWYYFNTRKIGTPFKDSLDQSQLEIKKEAVAQRKKIFINGIIVAIAIIILWRPFAECA